MRYKQRNFRQVLSDKEIDFVSRERNPFYNLHDHGESKSKRTELEKQFKSEQDVMDQLGAIIEDYAQEAAELVAGDTSPFKEMTLDKTLISELIVDKEEILQLIDTLDYAKALLEKAYQLSDEFTEVYDNVTEIDERLVGI